LEVTIGSKLKELRLQAGLTQVQLALASGLDQSMLARYESDQRTPSGPRLGALAKALGTSVEALLDGSQLPPPSVEPKPHVHGNSTKALVQKILDQINTEHQRAVLAYAKALLKSEEAEQALQSKPPETRTDTPKRRTRAA